MAEPITIAVSMGDPGGIGPEVLVKALADRSLREQARWVVHGVNSVMLAGAHAAGLPADWAVIASSQATFEHGALAPGEVLVIDHAPTPRAFPRVADAHAGEISFRCVEAAIAMCQPSVPASRRAHAIVTGPINKQAWALAGHGAFPGHTELLADRFGVRGAVMMFVAPSLRVVLVTTHIPLAKVPAALTVERISTVIERAREACVRLGIADPRIAVCGVNPHAGEDGLLGEEDRRVIKPAIEAMRAKGVEATGPWPGDTIFSAARAGKFDLVVAMYHDQGLIPVKLLERDAAVNVTLGLPTIRTSPDHGTAFDIAGRNLAEPGSMKQSLQLAVMMVRRPVVG